MEPFNKTLRVTPMNHTALIPIINKVYISYFGKPKFPVSTQKIVISI